MRAAVLAVLIVLLGAAPRAQGPSAARRLSLEQYLAALDVLHDTVAALSERSPDAVSSIIATVPQAWAIPMPTGEYRLPSDWLLVALRRWHDHPDADARHALVDVIAHRRATAAAALAPPQDLSAARTGLDRILSDKEFAGVHGPTWLDELRAAAMSFLERLLRNMLGSSAVPTVARGLVYALVALAAAILGVVIFRALRLGAMTELALDPAPAAPAAQPWQNWRADAQAAAAEGRWRDAVHFAFWCGAAFLETQGAWRPDATRTPREYVRLLPESAPAREGLGSLARQLEGVWYGTQNASAADFDRAITSLERLGCPSR